MRLALCILIVVCGSACRGDAPPTEPPHPRSGCGSGPVPIVTTGPEPCLTVTPQCPRRRPDDARTIVWVGTCGFAGRQGSCQPIQMPGCPGESKIVFMGLVHPVVEKQSCVIQADLHIDVRATPSGGATVFTEGFEYDPVSCRRTGPDLHEEAAIAGPCCEKVVDTYFQANDFTLRTVVRTDWQR